MVMQASNSKGLGSVELGAYMHVCSCAAKEPLFSVCLRGIVFHWHRLCSRLIPRRFDTQRICKQSILGFSRTSFLDHACAAFQLVHAATSSGSPQLIEQLKEVR